MLDLTRPSTCENWIQELPDLIVAEFSFFFINIQRLSILSPLFKTSDIISLITQDHVVLTMAGSLMIPAAPAPPYFGGLRLRKIDVEPHTAVLTSIVGASRGFTPISSMLARPVISLLIYYLLLFMGVCWSFALGCNLAADPAKRHLAKNVLSEKLTSKLVSSKSGSKTRSKKFVEVYPSFRDTVFIESDVTADSAIKVWTGFLQGSKVLTSFWAEDFPKAGVFWWSAAQDQVRRPLLCNTSIMERCSARLASTLPSTNILIW